MFVVIDVDDTDEAVAVADTKEAVAVVGAVDVVTVVLVFFFVDRIWRSGLSVYSASIAASGLPPPPSWLDPRSPVYGV